MFDMRQFFGGDQHEHPECAFSDPAKYPRSAEITNTEFLMTIQAMTANDERQAVLMKQAREIGEEITIVRAERQIIETKFWRAIREQYPSVATEGQCGMGYRKHEDKIFLVSWGDEDRQDNISQGEEN